MPPGRPPKRFNRRIASAILDRWATSRHTLEEVVNELRKMSPKFPSLRVVYAWKRENKEFLQAYRIAEQDRAEFLAELAWATADRPQKVLIKRIKDGKNGRETEIREEDDVAARRLSAEMSMRRAAQLHPAKFRDRNESTSDEDSNAELKALVAALQQGSAPTDPNDPSLNLGTTKPDFSEPSSISSK